MSHVWKTTPLARVGAVIATLFFIAKGVAIDRSAVAVLLALLVAGLAWLFAFRPAIILTGAEIIVRNPWGTRRIPLAEVAGVGAGWAGMSIRLDSERAVTAWAVQKSNGAKWSGRRTRADQVTTALAAAVSRATLRRLDDRVT